MLGKALKANLSEINVKFFGKKASAVALKAVKPTWGLLSVWALSACGGGGGGGSGPITSNAVMSFGNAVGGISLPYFDDGSDRWAVRYFYTKDIIGDNSQEVIIAGFETQPNTPAEYSSTQLLILSVENGTLAAISNDLVGVLGADVEGVGDVTFGDFNGDGSIDFFTSAYVDMEYVVNAYAFYNDENGFKRELVDISQWQHGVASLDINADGFDDVYSAGYDGAEIYIGSVDGLSEYSVSGSYGGGSHVALADFLNNGEVQAVVVDGAAPNGGTSLFSISVDDVNNTVTLEEITILPEPIMNTAEFDDILNQSIPRSHDVRVEAVDFSNDGLIDVVVFSRADNDPVTGQWPVISQVQFLENNGDGTFSDVTTSILPNYDFNSNVGYEPIIDDFNRDGYIDIFISDADFQDTHNSSVFLMGSSDGSFTESGRDILSQIIPSGGGMATVVRDNADDYFILVGTQSIGYSGRQEDLSLHPVDFL
jgi:hypothetical protein